MSRTILITTGATETFKDLIQFAVSKQFLEYLVTENFTHLIVQYGPDQSIISTSSHLTPVDNNNNNNSVESCPAKSNLQFFTFKQSLSVETYAFNSALSNDILKADYVISHAGTGSILDSLRAHRPLIVVVNNQLMDNHQAEIAKALKDLELLEWAEFDKSMNDEANYDQVIKKLKAILSNDIKFKEFPAPRNGVLNNILAEELGLLF
ncbi:N-acetylglucosaminyldiphosphodolichol N-acetylglucosaminyltransferase catalytic subunit [Saccharomycopsis crataegensis]|uniref:UDP-N-acetylglucosamine transferase subunit ALG13 n=1 Tax=Saccharomycopsis crataegensis TaxID=43959 RepID=A0AAV5QHW1_9ASCO|nr:N-acetylglucosaminyldiphosphodolichol N-acetylglucosaminyltransferase catalytic subunit [Saccharomycopsis crataegensis]